MPAQIWSLRDNGDVVSGVETRGHASIKPEDFTLADHLDTALDHAFDEAEHLRAKYARPDVPERFTTYWAVGRALRESGILNHDALRNESPDLFFKAAAAKFRTLTRADGTKASNWANLRPTLTDAPTNREGSRKGHDHWSMCLWLAEQEYDDAVSTFGGSIRNVWQTLERPTLASLVFREALRTWLAELPEHTARDLTSTRKFPPLMKAMRARWPGRGRRSALQPVHYEREELRREIEAVARSAGLLDTDAE
jgi:hypothetical protein